MTDYQILWFGDKLRREDASRFRRVCAEIAGPLVAIGIAAGLYKISNVEAQRQTAAAPPQYVQLLQPLTPPHVRETMPVQPVPKLRPQPAVRSHHSTPSRSNAGGGSTSTALRQLHAQLSAFGSVAPDIVTSNNPLATVAASERSGFDSREANGISRTAARSSGGIGKGGPDVTGHGSGVDIGAHSGARISSGFASGAIKHAAGASDNGEATGLTAQRSLQEVQWIFDRDKGGFSALFNSVARKTPGMLGGKIVVSLTIAPDGSVTRCELISSSFHNTELERLIVARVKQLNFGAKSVPIFTYSAYPINFLLS